MLTRWNNTYFMLKRLCEHKKAVARYCVDTANIPVHDASNWNLMAKLTNLLKIFYNTTMHFIERSAVCSEVIQQINFLEMFIVHPQGH